ncbi:sphinganine kinase lcb4 [Pleurotus pulmonarius]|nr:sphinganine kinase lcb4 [Pleurotus pulmonarius]
MTTSSPTASVSLSTNALSVEVKDKNRVHDIPFRDILHASFDSEAKRARIAYLKKSKGRRVLSEVHHVVHDSHLEETSLCLDKAMTEAYSGVKKGRRIKVLVNPFGGKGKGRAIFMQKVEPILRHAGCMLDVVYTTHSGHAYEIAKTLPLDQFDAIVTVSGDGLVHEVINGFAHHEHPVKALAVPIAPIPTGSGNGLSLNLLGLEGGSDVAEAALNVVKGTPMKVDLFSFVQNKKRSISFMSQALGLMADLDIGTDHLRWMGETRFMYGLIRGVLRFKPCPIQLSVKIAEQDKTKMLEALQARRQAQSNASSSTDASSSSSLPPLKFLPEDKDGWTVIDEPLLYVYAGKGPYVGRDFMAFPVSLPDDGLIDITIQPLSSRSDVLKEMEGAPRGEAYWSPKLKYFKAHAYRVKPLTPNGALSVDGEPFPFEEYQVEVHQRLGTLLSPHGVYVADFDGPPSRHQK